MGEFWLLWRTPAAKSALWTVVRAQRARAPLVLKKAGAWVHDMLFPQ